MGITCSVRESGSKCFWKRATKASANCLARGLLGWESCTLLRNCSIPASISCCPRSFAPVTSINSRMRASFWGSSALEGCGVPLARFGQARVGGHAGILFAEILQHVLGDSRAEGAVGGLHFRVDLGHLRGEFLAEWRAIKLQEALDFVLREMLIVNGNELSGSIIRVEFSFVGFDEGVHKLLAAVAGGDG